MIRIAIVIPIFTQALVATVLHSPHGVFLRLVDIQHLTTIFCLVDVQHLTASDGPTTIGVVGITDLLHLQHVLTTDALVTTFVEEDTGIVAVINDGIAHQFGTLSPAGTFHVFLGITCRHGLWQTNTVARLNVLLPWCHVHPSHHVAARLYHQPIAVVTEPCRYRQSDARPLVRRTLGVAMNHHHAVVKPYLTFTEAGLAETGSYGHLVSIIQRALYGIKVAIAP